MSLRSTARWLVVVLVVATFVVGMALPALAHHPEVTASVNCTGLVSYTATAWENEDPLRREHHDVRIDARTFDGTSWSAYAEFDSGQFLPSNSFTFSDTYQLNPVPQKVQLRARALGKWGPNQEYGDDYSEWETAELEVPVCPANPTAVAAPLCDVGGAKLTFTNTGGESIEFTVVRDGTPQPSVTVAGGGEETRTYTMTEDSTATFLVTAGEYSTSLPVTFNCLPAVQAQQGGPTVGAGGAVAGDVLPATGAQDLEYLAVALLLVFAGRGVLSSERLGSGKRF